MHWISWSISIRIPWFGREHTPNTSPRPDERVYPSLSNPEAVSVELSRPIRYPTIEKAYRILTDKNALILGSYVALRSHDLGISPELIHQKLLAAMTAYGMGTLDDYGIILTNQDIEDMALRLMREYVERNLVR